MKVSEIINRVTGISTPFAGVSWEAGESEVAAARRLIAFLEDRRVLYLPGEMEIPFHCVESVIEIRHRLSDEIGKLDSNSDLAASLRAMRAACRKFLDRIGTDDRRIIDAANRRGHYAGWIFYSALGEMRGTFGIHVAKIAVRFQLDVEDSLASILPADPNKDSLDDRPSHF